uniref:HAT C-terminal dimerisation domain-containing protein n=1 Tax=Neogobius melanostomus TaxID=47308 RepID=A0A8C6TVL0_9GOBI
HSTPAEMASQEEKDKSDENLAFSRWRYKHYFKFIASKGKNVHVMCTLCPGVKTLSTSVVSNSNLMKHLTTTHASTKLVAKNTSTSDDSTPSTSKEEGLGAKSPKQQKLELSASQQKPMTQAEVNRMIGRYVVGRMLPLSTVEDDSFRAIIAKIPTKAGACAPCAKTFAKYLDAEVGLLSTTADIWTAHNRSYLGVTAHWLDPHSLERKKAALACRRFKGRHTYDSIATELDNIHSSFSISNKITATVTDNGSNFVKAFKVYQPVQDDDSGEEEEDDDVTFVDLHDALQDMNVEEDVVTLPPHHRCASHISNLISCSDVDKWLISKPGIKVVYRSAISKCTALWNKASRSTVAAEMVDEVLERKLLVPCTTRWNSFHDAVARVCEFPIAELNTISYNFGLKAITDREYQFLREYCTVLKPLTVALDILQGEDNCFYGTLLPTLETLISKTLNLKTGLQILGDLPEAVVKAIKTRFKEVLESETAIFAAVTLPRFKLRWLRTQERKDSAKASLLAECRKSAQDEDQPTGTNTPTRSLSTDSAIQDEFFSFEEEEDTSTSVESQVADYLKSGAQGMDSLNRFPVIKNISLKYNAATPSSAPVERLFSLGKLVFTPKRNRLTDKRFEMLLLLRYNQWFEGRLHFLVGYTTDT